MMGSARIGAEEVAKLVAGLGVAVPLGPIEDGTAGDSRVATDDIVSAVALKHALDPALLQKDPYLPSDPLLRGC